MVQQCTHVYSSVVVEQYTALVASHLVGLVLLEDCPGLVVHHPREATVVLVSLEQSVGIKGPVL